MGNENATQRKGVQRSEKKRNRKKSLLLVITEKEKCLNTGYIAALHLMVFLNNGQAQQSWADREGLGPGLKAEH